jgi:Spy/CpxP family protein refolding chaperone
MKPAFAILILATVFSGHALVRKTLLAFDAPGQSPPASMMDSPAEGRPGMHPGGWWKDPELVQKLHISDDQIQEIEKIAQAHEISEVDLRADLEKQEISLRFQLEADPPDEAHVLAQIDKVTEVRARLEKSRVETLLAIRRILTSEQARKLRDLRPMHAPLEPGFGPSDRGGPERPPEGGPPTGLPKPPPNGNAN